MELHWEQIVISLKLAVIREEPAKLLVALDERKRLQLGD
jgi:hypothetical protein